MLSTDIKKRRYYIFRWHDKREYYVRALFRSKKNKLECWMCQIPSALDNKSSWPCLVKGPVYRHRGKKYISINSYYFIKEVPKLKALLFI